MINLSTGSHFPSKLLNSRWDIVSREVETSVPFPLQDSDDSFFYSFPLTKGGINWAESAQFIQEWSIFNVQIIPRPTVASNLLMVCLRFGANADCGDFPAFFSISVSTSASLCETHFLSVSISSSLGFRLTWMNHPDQQLPLPLHQGYSLMMIMMFKIGEPCRKGGEEIRHSRQLDRSTLSRFPA